MTAVAVCLTDRETGDPKVARFHLLSRLRPQPPPNHIHHITPIAQRYRQHFAKVGEHQRVGADFRAEPESPLGRRWNIGWLVRGLQDATFRA